MRLKASIAVAILVVAFAGRPSTQTAGSPAFVAGEIIVKFQPGTAAGAKGQAHRAAGAGAALQAENGRTGVQRIRVPAGREAEFIARYLRNPNVLYAELNYLRRLPKPLSASSAPDVVPGDAYFGEQWGFHNSGQGFYCIPWFTGELCLFAGTPDADIDAPEAWAVTTGNADVKVAVIDSGVDYTHPDIAPNFAGGADFVYFDGDPMDDNGHGTHVAGTIAAAMNNRTGGQEEGVAGVAPNARILAYKVCRVDGTCDDFAIQLAIARAISDGARVINMSLGQPAYSRSLDEAVQDAWDAGLVIVAGSGNDGVTQPFYPAAFDNVVSVGAFDAAHERAPFSNYGNWVDLAAPGDFIMSSYPMGSCDGSASPGETGCYAWLSGTSMATPHVAGAAALVWSRSDVTSNRQVVDILLGSADRLGVGAARLDSWTLHGGLNLLGAVTYSTTRPVANAGADQTVSDADGNGSELVSLDGTASSDPDGTLVSYTWREGATVVAIGATAAVSLPAGPHTLTLEVADDAGNTATDTVVITVNSSTTVSVAASTAQAAEPGGSGLFTISRTGDTSAPLTVPFTVGGSATAGADYAALSGQATIEAGAAAATVPVTVLDDAAFENDETVVLTLGPGAGYSVGAPASATVTITSDDSPADLVVVSVTVPTAGGADLDVVVTDATKNQGTGTSPASATAFYLSFDTTLDASDVLIGSRPVPVLAPQATSIVSTTLRVPASTVAGSYRVLAKADWDNGVEESGEDNNARSSGIIRIGPDLVITTVTAPASLAAGSTFTVSDTAKNQGAGAAAASTTRFFLSLNTSVDAGDVSLGARPVAALAPGATESGTITLTIPAATDAGSYYVLAQADGPGVVPETSETNNVDASGVIKIGPDLTVTALTAPATADPGGTIIVSDTTKNQGAGGAAASSTGFYLSPNASFDATDVFLGSRPVGELAASGTASASTSLVMPADVVPGDYFVIAKADWNGVVGETSESNNTKTSTAIKVGGDLVISAFSVPATAAAGGSISVTDTTKNQGAAPVPASVTGFYLSDDATYAPGDQPLGSRNIAALAAAATASATTSLVIPATTSPGTYYVIAVADATGAIDEISESNNTRSVMVRIGPDLTVTTLTGPTSAVAGTSIAVGDTTRNQGGAVAAASATRFYLSVNSSLGADDVLLGWRAVPLLAAGASHAGTTAVVIPAATAAGSYFIIARGDGDDAIAESLETNNTRTKSITVTAP